MANAATTAPVPNLPGTRSSSGLKYYPEGGWGWIVVISVFITQVITLGLHLSFGVTFYVFQIVNYADRNLTAWSGSFSFGLCHLLSPVILCLTFKFGPRKVALFSSLSTFASLLLCSFTTSTLLFVLCYGLLFGVASSMCLVTSFIILCQYFSKKRIRVIAIVHSGAGFGSALLAPLLFECARYSGWFLALLVPSLLSLLLIPLACAFRPVEMYYPGRLKPQGPRVSAKLLDTVPPVNPMGIKAFQLWLLVTFFSSLGFYIPISLLIDVCVSADSLSSSNSVIMLVIFGTFFSFGCALAAAYAEFDTAKQLLQLRTVIQLSLFLSTVAVSFLILPNQSLFSTILFVTLFGISSGNHRCLSVAFLHELMGVKLFSHSWALQNCITGVGYMLGLPVAIYIRDILSGSYQYTSLLFSAIAYLISTLLMFGMKRTMQDPSRAFLATLDYPPTTYVTSSTVNGDVIKNDFDSDMKVSKFEHVNLMSGDESVAVKSQLTNQVSLKESHDSLYQTISPNQAQEDATKCGTYLGLPDQNESSAVRPSSLGSSVLKSIKQSIGSTISLVTPTDNSSPVENAAMLRNKQVNEHHVTTAVVSGDPNTDKYIERMRQHDESFDLDADDSIDNPMGYQNTDEAHEYADLTHKGKQYLIQTKQQPHYHDHHSTIHSPGLSSGSNRTIQSSYRNLQNSPNFNSNRAQTLNNNNNNNNTEQPLSSPGSTTSVQRKKRLPPDPSLYPEYYENSSPTGVDFTSSGQEPTTSSTMSRMADIERRMNQYAYTSMTSPRRYETSRTSNSEHTTVRAVKHRVGSSAHKRGDSASRNCDVRGITSPVKSYEPPWKNQMSMDIAQGCSANIPSEDSSDQYPSPPESIGNQDPVLRHSDVYLAFTDNDRESIL
ncbi:uncharacterized protein LOC142343004 isoform X2 [Convolutriloba macropyga]|uniref:uncharacterized protein LOC142343004 isoform X2 n=1 Tax=Convolutriloba macropyga TaxID=536237 RepID=UPI003F524D33